MSRNACPGRDLGQRDPERIVYGVECSKCGTDIEFWFDDKKRPCSNCGELVRPSLETLMGYHGCASSCNAAKDCLGDEEYVNLVLRERRTPSEGEKELKQLLGLISSNEKEVLDYLTPIIQKNLETGFLLDTETDIEPLKEKEPELYITVTMYLRQYVLGE